MYAGARTHSHVFYSSRLTMSFYLTLFYFNVIASTRMYIWHTDFITRFYFIFPSTDLYSMYMYMFYCIFYMYYVLLYVLYLVHLTSQRWLQLRRIYIVTFFSALMTASADEVFISPLSQRPRAHKSPHNCLLLLLLISPPIPVQPMASLGPPLVMHMTRQKGWPLENPCA